MKFILDNFDTNILCKKAYKLFLNNEIENENILYLTPDIKESSIFCCFTKYFRKNILFLEKNNFSLISTRNIYTKKIDSSISGVLNLLEKDIKIIDKTEFKNNNSDIKSLHNIIESIYRTSRYYKDEKISDELAMKIYKKWFYNSIFEDFSDEVFLLVSGNNKYLGIITLKFRNYVCHIDLISVDKDYKNSGLGKILLAKSNEYILNQKCNMLTVITEAENVGANAFYQKNNFILKDFKLIYHKHYD